MESTKERKEKVEKGQTEQKGSVDPIAKAREVLQEAVISKDDGKAQGDNNDEKEGAKDPDDILVFARAVHHTDSSLD